MSDKPVVYLAGKVQGVKWEVVRPFGSSVEFVSSDGDSHSEHEWGGSSGYGASTTDIEIMCLERLDLCDFLIAVLDTPDSFGSIAEIAYASAHGKKCYLVIIDPYENLFESSLYDAYWFISNFPRVVVHAVQYKSQVEPYLRTLLQPFLLKGYVYLIGSEDGYHKIGRSKDIAARFSALKIQLPFKIIYEHAIGVFIDTAKAESFMHNKFKAYRMNGEWFRLPAEAVEWIKSLKDGDIDALMGPGLSPIERVQQVLEKRQHHYLSTVIDAARVTNVSGDLKFVFPKEAKHLLDVFVCPANVRLVRSTYREVTGRDVGVRVQLSDA